MDLVEPHPGMVTGRTSIDRPQRESGTAVRNAVAGHPDLGLYVHFPWCVKKCPYCDFNSHPLHGDLQEEAYIQALMSEFRARTGARGPDGARRSGTSDADGGRHSGTLDSDAVRHSGTFDPDGVWRFDSVFFGGGTPSLFSAPALATLIETFRPHLRDDAEITMEANPGAAERDDLATYRDAGINRLSIGAQSFSPRYLKRLGRIHGPEEIGACVEAARRGGFDNINLDLMYGLPAQTAKEALADLEAAIALMPEHLSWYQLTIEPRTEFARRPPRNMPGEESIFEIENAGRALLDGAGFRRYEISAYAKPGAVCRHNLVYWTFGDYLGLGAGAHGKFGSSEARLPGWRETGVAEPLRLPGKANSLSSRRRNAPADTSTVPQLQDQTAGGPEFPAGKADKAGRPTIRTGNPRQPRLYVRNPCHTEIDRVDPAEVPGEFMMNALRLVGGVERGLFEARTGLSWGVVAPAWEKLNALGLVESDRVAATSHGLRHLDTLIQHFL